MQVAKFRRRSAMTLIELLAVVMIAVVILAAIVPQVRPALEQGRLREASRQMSAYFALAKSLAAQRGRPVGVALQRPVPGSNAALDLFMLETPPAYTGDLIGARAVVGPDPGNNRYEISFGNSASLTAATSAALVQPNESFFVRFNYMGPLYGCYRDTNGDFVIQIGSQPPPGFWSPGPDKQWGVANTDDDNNSIANDLREAGWPSSDDSPIGLPFQVYMFPARSVTKPLQLSGSVAVDLQYSGYGVSGTQFAADNVIPNGPVDNQPIIVMFSPSGAVITLYQGELTGTAVPLTRKAGTGTVYFLVGRFDQVRPPPIFNATAGTWSQPPSTANQTNLVDLQSVWVAIETRNGAVTTAENVAGTTVREVRELARTGSGMGAN